MNKTDLKDWTRDMLEAEIINMNAKNFRLQSEVNNLRESNRRLQSQLESEKVQFKEDRDKNNSFKRDCFQNSKEDKKQDIKEKNRNIKEMGSNHDDISDNMYLDLLCMLNLLSNFSSPLEGHGYYYKYGGGKCRNQVYFTEGIGLHDGTNGKPVELR